MSAKDRKRLKALLAHPPHPADLPTVRLANLIAGEESALSEPPTEPGTSGSAEVDAMRAAHAHVLSAAHAYAAADRAEVEARNVHKLKQRAADPRDPALQQVLTDLKAALLTAEDATREARSVLHRAVRKLGPQESKFDVMGAP